MDILKELLKNAPVVDLPEDIEDDGINSIVTDKEACAKDMSLFAKTYFPDIFSSDFCEMHKEVIESVQNMVLNKKIRKNYYCRAAPRGHGKSQIISFLLPLWCICYGYKKNILIVSDSSPQAKQFVMAITAELEDNELLIRDFGDLKPPNSSPLPWSQDRFVTKTGIHCSGKGAGQKLRGIKWRSNRPDLVVIDDLENDELVETELQRAKLKNWFTKALLPVGCPTVDIIYIGTILHYEALLQTILTDKKYSMWDRKLYRAIYKFSDSPLWLDWEQIILDQSREDPAADAYEFYKEHKEEMLKDVECLWPGQSEDYYHDLMVIRVQDEAAFNSEYQNEPIDPSKAEFLEEWFRYWYELPEIVAVYGAVDPSMGKSDKSDCSSILWLGKGADNYLYVLEVDVRRRTPDKIIDDIIVGAIKYQHLLESISVETIQFQQMFSDTLKERCLAAGLAIDWDEVKPFGEKNNRIRGLIPKVKNGYILLHPTQVALINELRRFPKGRDDALDTLQMAVARAFPAVSGFTFGKIDYSSSKLNPKYQRG